MFPLRLPYLDAELLLTPAGAPWLPASLRLPALIALCLVPLALMLWLYRYELQLISRATATLLLCLRLVVLFVLLMLACLKPVYARDVHRELPGRVLVFVDRSASMDVTDPQRTPAEKLRLAKALKLASGLASDQQLDEWIAGHAAGGEMRWVKPDEARDNAARRRELEAERRKLHEQVIAKVDALTRTGTARRILESDGLRLFGAIAEKNHEIELVGFHREAWDVAPGKEGPSLADLFGDVDPSAAAFTNLRLPLVRALERSGPGKGKVLGIVLLTDGKQNIGGPAEVKARELGERGVPIFPIALGATTPPPNVAIVSVRGPNHTVFKGVEADVAVRFKISGRKAQKFVLELFRQDKTGKEIKVGEREIAHDGKEHREPREERVTVRFDEPGSQNVIARLRPARAEPERAAIASVKGPRGAPFTGGAGEVAVRFELKNREAQEYVIELRLQGKDEGDRKLVAQKLVRHDGHDRVYEVKLPVRLDGPDVSGLVATARPGSPERSTTVSVADDKADVLLVDGEARWEFHYLATALRRDPTMKLSTVVFEQPRIDPGLTQAQLEAMGSPRQHWPPPPATPDQPDPLNSFQCIIVGDVAVERMTLAERVRLEKYVADAGGTLVILAGKRHMPMELLRLGGPNDPLRRLLPIEAPRVLAPDDGFPLALAQAGRDANFMKLDPESADDAPDDKKRKEQKNEELWAGVPRPWGWAIVGKAKPGAVPLAYVAEPGDEKRPPSERERNNSVVARHNYGFGRVLFVGLDSTWRWRFREGDRYHHRFWGQAIRWAAADKPLVTGNAFVRFGTPQPTYRQDEPIKVVARFNETLGAVKSSLLAGARVIRLADAPNGPEKVEALVPLARLATQARVLEGTLRTLPPGRYAIELAIPDLADKLLGPAAEGQPRKPLRSELTILPPETGEMIDLESDWEALKDLAAKSGGKAYTAENAAELVERLTKASVPHVEHHEQRLYQWWVVLALVVGLLTLEWGGRKLAGLP